MIGHACSPSCGELFIKLRCDAVRQVTCAQHNHDWHRDCAEAGNPVCQYLFAQTHHDPTQQKQDPKKLEEAVKWMTKAAQSGYSEALGAMRRSAPGEIHRQHARNFSNSESAFLLAKMLLQRQAAPEAEREPEEEAVEMFEIAAAGGDHASKSKYNLGVAHLYGYGVPQSRELAVEWFAASGLPEGFYAMSIFHRANGHADEAVEWVKRAQRLGFGKWWRAKAVMRSRMDDLHSAWPGSLTPHGPPQW